LNNYILKACRRCGGDLAKDCDDWICLQCGRYSYVGLYGQPEPPVDSLLTVSANPMPVAAEAYAQYAGGGGGREKAVALSAQGPALAGALR
jgi:hypothetical protein